jgi:spore maturation protein A
MVNTIWLLLIIIGIIYAFLTGNLDKINTTIIDSTKVSLDMLLRIFPILALWMGFTEIAEKSHLLDKFSKLISPILGKLFPDIPKNHPAISYIASNVIANIFGLGSAATPFGLKAMDSLQELNSKKDTATRSMITFLVLNTSGLTIVPTTIISLRLMYGSLEPTKIVGACLISTIFATVGGLVVDKMLARRYKD